MRSVSRIALDAVSLVRVSKLTVARVKPLAEHSVEAIVFCRHEATCGTSGSGDEPSVWREPWVGCDKSARRLFVRAATRRPTRQLAIVQCKFVRSSGKDKEMQNIETLRSSKVLIGSLMLVGLLIFASSLAFSRGPRSETIEATAFGTGTQLGQNIGVTLNIYDFSTPADRQILVQAFEKGQNQGLVNALQKMKAVGHVEITGTLGNDCSYIKMIPTPTGRKIVFVTNRQIRFGEAFFDTQSQSFNLTAGILEINDQDKSKSTGVLYPEAQLILNKQGELQWDLNQNAWKLVDLIDWPGTPGVN